MSTPFDFESWDSDFELGADTFELGDMETEWDGELGRRRRPAKRPARSRIVRRRPPPSRLLRAPRPPLLRPRPRVPVRPRPRFPVRPLFPVILPPWGFGQPPLAAPPPAEPSYREPSYAEPAAAEPPEPATAEPMAAEPMPGEPITGEPPDAAPPSEPTNGEPPAQDEPSAQDEPPTEEFFQAEAFAFEAEPGEFEAWQAEAPRQRQPQPSRGSADYIRWLQAALNRILGLNLAIDGVIGAQTRSAVRSFQQRRGLTADGVVGPRTEAALIAAGAPRPDGVALAAACPPQPVNVDCPPPGTPPTEVLDNFGFDKAALNPARHIPRIVDVARRILANQASRQPVRSVLIAGHTDVVGDENYNFGLGWRRATAVMNELCNTLERMRPGASRSIKFQLTSCGERQPKPTPEQSRRVEIFFVATPAPARPVPPDHSICGVPKNSLQAETGLAFEVRQLRRTARAQAARARLSLFQNASNTSHRNHFQCQASRWARRIAAIESPDASNCRRRVGPTPYDTGADVIRAIEAARRCAGQKINAVHVFSHSGSLGIFGTLSGGSVGLYSGTLDADSRRDGGRIVSDVPTAPFSKDVVFVLHGCNTARGDDNFARALFEHLAASLGNPTVYGHYNSGCAGRDNSWREYSRRSRDGRRRPRSIAPHYSGSGCCG